MMENMPKYLLLGYFVQQQLFRKSWRFKQREPWGKNRSKKVSFFRYPQWIIESKRKGWKLNGNHIIKTIYAKEFWLCPQVLKKYWQILSRIVMWQDFLLINVTMSKSWDFKKNGSQGNWLFSQNIKSWNSELKLSSYGNNTSLWSLEEKANWKIWGICIEPLTSLSISEL